MKFIEIEEWYVFKSLRDLVFPSLPDGSKLSKFDMVLLFLMKIRLNVIIDIRTVKGLETESISGQRRVSLMNNHKQFRQLLAQCAKGQIAAVL